MPKGIYKRTEEGRRNLSLAHIGYHPTEETKMKMRKINIGNTYCLGHKLSEAHKEKISLSLMGDKNPMKKLKNRIKCSLAKKGKKITEEHRRKLILSHLGKKQSKETIEKRSGKNNHFWQGGKSFEEYPMNWKNTLKKSIRERDHYTCQICGEKQENTNHSVHHIDYDKKNCNPSNLITLCRRCHARTNCNRKYWTKLLIIKI